MPIPVTDARDAPTRWADLVRQGGYLTPAQREAFERAIEQVTQNLHQVLAQKGPQRSGRFDFDAFVDSLEQDFLRHDARSSSISRHSDVAQTAFWVVRVMADHLIELSPPQKIV